MPELHKDTPISYSPSEPNFDSIFYLPLVYDRANEKESSESSKYVLCILQAGLHGFHIRVFYFFSYQLTEKEAAITSKLKEVANTLFKIIDPSHEGDTDNTIFPFDVFNTSASNDALDANGKINIKCKFQFI